MPISKIKTGSITDSAVNTDKLAPGSVGSSDISTDLVTGLTELSETAADTDFTIIFDTSSGTLKKILRSNLKQAGPVISSISPTNANESEATATFTITGTGFTAGSNARFIDANGKITEFDTVTRNSTTQITATIASSSLSGNNDPYDVQVTNGEGISTILTSQVNFNASPVFVTASGSLATIQNGARTGISLEVNATDPESAAAVTFEIQSGSLPAGLSLTNTGANGGTALISGDADAVGSNTTYNFTLRAVDNASNTSSRAFSITVNAPVSESFTSSGTFSVPAGVTAVDVLVVAGGGGGGAHAGSGYKGGAGGAGGLVFVPGFPVTPGGTIPVTVGNPGGGGGAGNSGAAGQDSVFSTLTAKGGGYGGFGSVGGGANGGPGGSGGGAGSDGSGPGATNTGGSATQPTQPGQSGAYGFGNAGGPTNSYNSGNGGGGGGAGGVGAPGNNQPAPGGIPASGQGGAGKAYTIADGTTPVTYAVGGRGGISNDRPSPRCAAANRGGGGPGGNPDVACGGNGGKGIVIVRY